VGDVFTVTHYENYSIASAQKVDNEYGFITRDGEEIYQTTEYQVWGFYIPENQGIREQRRMRTVIGNIEYQRGVLYLYGEDTGGVNLVKDVNISVEDTVDIYGETFMLTTCQPYSMSQSTLVYYKCNVKPQIDRMDDE